MDAETVIGTTMFLIAMAMTIGFFTIVYKVGKWLHARISGELKAFTANRERIYNDLPDLGKARVDKNVAQTGKVVTTVAAGGFLAIVYAINPFLALLSLLNVGRGVKNVWKHCDADEAAAEAKLAKAHNSEAGMGR